MHEMKENDTVHVHVLYITKETVEIHLFIFQGYMKIQQKKRRQLRLC